MLHQGVRLDGYFPSPIEFIAPATLIPSLLRSAPIREIFPLWTPKITPQQLYIFSAHPADAENPSAATDPMRY